MYCPNCGTQTSGNEKFCRSCGMSMGMISQLLAKLRSAAESGKTPAEIAELTESRLEKPWRRRLRRSLFIAGVVPILAVLLTNIGHLIGRRPEALPWMLLIALLIGIVLGKLLKTPFERQSSQATVLPSAETTSKLPPSSSAELMCSVTEPTTRSLEPALHKQPSAHE